jgi:glycosyltransferase involved in cell wall biosynthesis
MTRSTSGMGALIITTTQRATSAHVAAASLLRQHPEIGIDVVVVDDRFREIALAWRGSPGPTVEWFAAAELLDPRRVADALAELSPDDAVTALTPAILLWALERRSSAVLLMADHVVVQQPVTGFVDKVLTSSAGDSSVGLVMVRSDFPPVDGRLPDATDLFTYGRMQRSFALFGKSSQATVLRWTNLVAHQRFEDVNRLNRLMHPWFDQLAAAPGTDAVVVGPEVVGSFRNFDSLSPDIAVTAIDFDGFNPLRPWVLSDHAGNWPRVLLSDHPRVAEATRRYVDHLGSVEAVLSESPYSRLSTGHHYDPAMRLVYRNLLHDAKRHGSALPAHPFSDTKGFVELLVQPQPGRPGISRHLAAWAEVRPDLATTFAHDDAAFWKWAEKDAGAAGIWTPLPQPSSQTGDANVTHLSGATSDPAGINVVGLLSAQLGVGEHGRLALRTVGDSGIPFSVIDHDDTIHHRDLSVLDGFPTDGFRYDVDLLLVNADQTETALQRLLRPGHPARPTIGVWAWEVPVFPERFHAAYQHVSEVWVLSDFVRESLTDSASVHGVDVQVFPLQLPYLRDRMPGVHYSDVLAPLGVDVNRPIFSFMFDYFSVAERKQPWRTIDAFITAFPMVSPHGPQLVIKSMNHQYFPVERERTRHAARGRSDVVFVEQYLTVMQRDALISAATAYVSLHRSEGFGLTLAEAMGAGTPCIATSWSGNLDFMTDANSFLVDMELIDVEKSVPAYGGMGQWADPSVDHAARLMQQVLDQPDIAAARATQAITDLRARNSSGADTQFVVDRIRRVRSKQSSNRTALPGVHP